MADTAKFQKPETRSFKISAAWLQFAAWAVLTLLAGGVAWGALNAKHESAVAELREVKTELKDVRKMAERLARVEQSQEDQGKTLDRIDRTLQQLAKGK